MMNDYNFVLRNDQSLDNEYQVFALEQFFILVFEALEHTKVAKMLFMWYSHEFDSSAISFTYYDKCISQLRPLKEVCPLLQSI